MESSYQIVDTQHALQKRDKELRSLLDTLIKKHRVVLIAEEVDGNLPDALQITMGRTLTAEKNMPWPPLGMNFDEERQAGIYETLQNAFKLRQQGVNAHAKDAEDVRENDWLDKIRDECDKRGIAGGVVIIVCGRNHLPFIAEKARGRGIGKVEVLEHPGDLGASLDALVIV